MHSSRMCTDRGSGHLGRGRGWVNPRGVNIGVHPGMWGMNIRGGHPGGEYGGCIQGVNMMHPGGEYGMCIQEGDIWCIQEGMNMGGGGASG